MLTLQEREGLRGIMLADKFHPNLSLTGNGVERGLWIQKEAKKKAVPGEESGGSSEKGWDKRGSVTVLCCPEDQL